MNKTVAIVQSNYIPWKGYFDLIDRVDEFILYDDMQYTRRDWRNRNKIKTAQGLKWLTIPVQVRGKYYQKIKDTLISDPSWHTRHWKTIQHHYARARYYQDYKAFLEELYVGATAQSLSDINLHCLSAICSLLNIKTTLSRSMDYSLESGKTERLVDLCRQVGARRYISGPAARSYLDITLFERAGIAVEWMDYGGYPEYEQLSRPFVHGVSIIDVILNCGPHATRYMKRCNEHPVQQQAQA